MVDVPFAINIIIIKIYFNIVKDPEEFSSPPHTHCCNNTFVIFNPPAQLTANTSSVVTPSPLLSGGGGEGLPYLESE